MLLFEATVRRLERAGGRCGSSDGCRTIGAEQANEGAVRERSELVHVVDVDVAHAAGTAPFGGGVHSFGVGDRDRDAARWGWGRAARRPPLMFVLLDIRLPACLLVSVCLDFPPTSREIPPFSIFLSLYLSLPIYLSISVPRTFRAAPSLI